MAKTFSGPNGKRNKFIAYVALGIAVSIGCFITVVKVNSLGKDENNLPRLTTIKPNQTHATFTPRAKQVAPRDDSFSSNPKPHKWTKQMEPMKYEVVTMKNNASKTITWTTTPIPGRGTQKYNY